MSPPPRYSNLESEWGHSSIPTSKKGKAAPGEPWCPAFLYLRCITGECHMLTKSVVKSQGYPSAVTKKKPCEITVYIILVQMVDKRHWLPADTCPTLLGHRYPRLSAGCLGYRSPSLTMVGRSAAWVSGPSQALLTHWSFSSRSTVFVFLNFLFVYPLCLSYHVSWSHPSPPPTK